jgi:hypothetical protein
MHHASGVRRHLYVQDERVDVHRGTQRGRRSIVCAGMAMAALVLSTACFTVEGAYTPIITRDFGRWYPCDSQKVSAVVTSNPGPPQIRATLPTDDPEEARLRRVAAERDDEAAASRSESYTYFRADGCGHRVLYRCFPRPMHCTAADADGHPL